MGQLDSTSEFRAVLTQLIKARNPVLLVETHEEERVVDAVMAVALDRSAIRSGRKVVQFSLTRGLHEPGGTGNPVAPDRALALSDAKSTPGIQLCSSSSIFITRSARARR